MDARLNAETFKPHFGWKNHIELEAGCPLETT
jgi:hypothetical protein